MMTFSADQVQKPYVPPRQDWPDDQDLAMARQGDSFRGTSVASYVGDNPARVSQTTVPQAVDWYNTGNERSTMGVPTQELTDQTGKAAIAAQRNPVAALGFDPSKMRVSPETPLRKQPFDIPRPTQSDPVKATIAGAYDPDTDRGWYDARSKSTPVHESMHRGMKLLRDAGRMPSIQPYTEEELVRGMMVRNFGDIEMGKGELGDNQVKTAKALLKRDDFNKILDKVETAAAQLNAKRRPGGPR